MEFMEGGNLTGIILDKTGDFSEAFIKYSLYKVALGLQKMHYHNVLHRDIKSDNILCRPNGDIKIADLGLSIFLSEQQQYRITQKGTVGWFSPEIAQGVTYSKEVDVWAFGCFAFELAQGYPPWQDLANDISLLLYAIIHDPVPRIPSKWSDTFADFCNKCLLKTPEERWSINQLLNHEFLVGAEQYREQWIAEYAQWSAN